MKYVAYILKDENGLLYKGVTNNLARRLKEHKGGHTVTTSRMKNVRVVYSEEYDTFLEARTREVYFKSAAGRKFLKSKIMPL